MKGCNHVTVGGMDGQQKFIEEQDGLGNNLFKYGGKDKTFFVTQGYRTPPATP